MSTPQTPPPAGGEVDARKPSRFSGFHAQTFEMELLVSGALTFTLLQVAGRVSQTFERTMLMVDRDLRLLVVYGFIYVLLAIYALVGFFASHLLLRAFWIGLVGLESVYPGGTDWERVKLGRHTSTLLRRRIPPLGASIDRLDDICSLVFSLAFMIVLTFVYSIGLVLVSLAIAWAAAATGWAEFEPIFWIVLVGWMVASTAIGLLDRYVSARLEVGGRTDRILGALVRGSLVVSPMRLMGPITLVLQTRLSEKRTNVMIVVSVTLLSGALLLGLFARSGLLQFGSLVYVPEQPGSAGIDPKSFRSNWTDADGEDVRFQPSIDTDVVVGPYVRLFVPYRPLVHNGRIARACPDVEPARRDGLSFGRPQEDDPLARTQAALACFAGLFQFELDGQPLTGARFDWYTEPLQELPGVIAYLDVRDLERGRHELRIDMPRGDPPVSPGDEDRRRQLVIPFWR